MVLFHGLVHAVGDMNSEKLGTVAQMARDMHLQREQFAREDEEKRLQQQNRLTQAQIDYAVSEATSAGLRAQATALKDALRQVSPNHPLLQQDGNYLKNGSPSTQLTTIWIRKFDTVISKMINTRDPSKFRNV